MPAVLDTLYEIGGTMQQLYIASCVDRDRDGVDGSRSCKLMYGWCISVNILRHASRFIGLSGISMSSKAKEALEKYWCILCAILSIVPVIPACGRENVTTLTLYPNAPALANCNVPLLTEEIFDADRLETTVLQIDPIKPCHWVYSPGDQIYFKVAGIKQNKTESAVLTVWDWENRPIAQNHFAMPFQETIRMRVPGRGTYVLTLDGMSNDKCEYRLVRSFSVCPSNENRRRLWKNNGFWIGQCSFPGWMDARSKDGHTACPPQLTSDEARELDAKLVSRMGAQIARLDMSVIRKDQDGMNLDFSVSDKCVHLFTNCGLDLDLQIFRPYGGGRGPILPKYSDVPIEKTALFPIKEDAYRHYVSEIIQRYGKYARFVQVGNEPDNDQQYGGTPEDYCNELRLALDEVRKRYPDLPVTNGGYCNTSDDTIRIIEGIKGLTDFVSYHCHENLDVLRYFLSKMQEMHNKYSYDHPDFANTEMGYSMPTVGGERANAVFEMQKIFYCWAHGNKGVMLYSSRETFWPRQYMYDGISDYGFVDYYFCPRFVYGTMSAFLDKLAGFQFSHILQESDNIHAYEFISGNRRIIAVFAAKEPAVVRFTSDAKRASILDPMGNSTRCDDPRIISVHVGEYPIVVSFDRSTMVELQN